MPFVTNRGQRIHYPVEGGGPLVILQHGLFCDAASWKADGFVDALTEKYRLACVDSLGHGLSDKPSHPELYGQQQRSGDIVAVIDDLGYDRAHLVGYSMGGWMSVGVAKYHPRRLASVVIGGWDVVNGAAMSMPPRIDRSTGFDWLLKVVGEMAPELVEWVTPDVLPGLRTCWDVIDQLEGAGAAVLNSGIPILLRDGHDDAYHDPMKAFAAANKLQFTSIQGDHIQMIKAYGRESTEGIRAFLDAA
jgi:pimeloyl-ACP methyl ester carboxylesterase